MKSVGISMMLLALVYFGVYSIAPLFGLDEVMPELLGRGSWLGRAFLIGTGVIGVALWYVGGAGSNALAARWFTRRQSRWWWPGGGRPDG